MHSTHLTICGKISIKEEEETGKKQKADELEKPAKI